MKTTYLNIGCGSRKLPGFINIDLDPGADLRLDVRQGLPFESGAVHGIFCEHFIEHLSQADGAAFLRECRRVLASGGVLRIATPDLEDVVANYHDEKWKEQEWLKQFGLGWVDNRCELMNVAMREWGHQWVYNEEELTRLAGYAGFSKSLRCRLGESEHSIFRGTEWRNESTLIIEFTKVRPHVVEGEPLVSVLIAAYNPKYFRESLESALSQSYRNLEIVVSDDCPTDEIRDIVSEYRDERIRYIRNRPALGGGANLLRCFDIASGEYIKFLNDDDLLRPQCVARMADCLNRFPDVTLVTSHRDLIDANGAYLGEIGSTTRPVAEDSIIEGTSMAALLLSSGLNFIGEPSTAMFRKQDLAVVKPDIVGFAGRPGIWNADVMMWLNLLTRGDAVYLVESLSCFRMHPDQQSEDEESKSKGIQAWQAIRFDGQRMGILRQYGPKALVTRPLDAPSQESVSVLNGVNVSIVIPVFNQVEFTRRCLDTLYRNTPESTGFEVIVVDNGSTDGTSALLREIAPKRPRLRVLTNKENQGFARACNQGAGAGSGRYLLFLNNDTEVQPGWLEPLMRICDADPNAAAAGSKLLRPDGTVDNAGIAVVDHRQHGDPLLAMPVYSGTPSGSIDVNQPRVYQALTAACILVRSSAFRDVDGFDEGYWNGYEDVDLCFKFQERSWHAVYVPQSVVIHHVSQSGPERFRRVRDNIDRLHKKWLGKITPDLVVSPKGELLQSQTGRIRQYLIPSVESDKQSASRMVSVVIPVFNQVDYTRNCLKTLLDDEQPKEIIVVDNGSTDDTAKLADEFPDVRYVRNEENRGFAAACNQGIQAAAGDYVLLLNNDTLMPKGTISRLVSCAESDGSIGLAVPVSNFVRGVQLVTGCEKPEDYQRFADRLASENRGRRHRCMFVAGLCLLIRREVIEKVGLLDESYGIGNYEDDDYCIRCHLAGYRNIVAADAFVYHFGSRTFASADVDYVDLLEENFQKFYAKWGHIEVIHLRLANDLATYAKHHGEAEDYEAAFELFRRALEKEPKHRDALLGMGICLTNAGWLPDAIQTLGKLVELYPDDAEALETFEECRRLAGRVAVEHVGRNEPCPCGSGKKYKKCCLHKEGAAQAA